MTFVVSTPSAMFFPWNEEKNFGFILKLTEQTKRTRLNLPMKREAAGLSRKLKRFVMTFMKSTYAMFSDMSLNPT